MKKLFQGNYTAITEVQKKIRKIQVIDNILMSRLTSIFKRYAMLCAFLISSLTNVQTYAQINDMQITATALNTDQIIDIPDANFKQALIHEYIDTNNDGEISVQEANSVTYLMIDYKGIKDLKGLEYFSNLVWLNCRDNNISTLDLSNLANLEELDCSNNNISTLDLSSLANLEELDCRDNNSLDEIDVSNNINLTSMDVSNNSLDEIDISKNTELASFLCHHNNITGLETSKNVKLDYLYCTGNDLSTIDLSNNKVLRTLNIRDCNLTELDVSNNPELSSFSCGDNNLIQLDISNNLKLSSFSFRGNNISNIDITCHKSLRHFNASDNKLTKLDASNNTNLIRLECQNNNLTEICVWDVPYANNSAIFKKDSNADWIDNCGDLCNSASLSTENLNANNISIYKSSFNEITINGLTAQATFKIFSITGKEVMQTSFTSNGKKVITLPSLAKGVYIVQLTTEAGKVNKKIILE
jgi:Leucine-rich repeat (LRR) protein